MSERRPRNTPSPRAGTGRRELPRRPGQPSRPRRVSRREREAHQRRRLYWGLGIAGAIIVVILGFALTNENVIKPRKVLASVNGTDIQRQDYWRYRGVQLLEQVNQYSRIAGLVSSDQAGQYRQAAAQAQADFNNLWGSTDVDNATLQQMIDDQVYLQNVDDLGLSISRDEVDAFILNRFAPQDAPILPETPSATLIPTRAAWATQTAAADPGIQATTAAEAALGSPAATPIGASPESDASPVGDIAASPSMVATPNATEAVSTAEANYALYRDSVFDRAHISAGQYRTWVARPQLARDKVTGALDDQVGQTAEQVLASHILVGTEELARQIRAELDQPGADFAAIASTQSTDTGSATNGGDLGWFTRGEMVAPFEEAAFSLRPGEISQPIQSEFGWHIIYVRDHEQNRPMTDAQIQKAQERVVNDWLAQQKADAKIDSDINPTATAEPSVFEPPVNAPAPAPAAPTAAAPAPTGASMPRQPGSSATPGAG